jgi:hypothetical protein
MTFKEIGRVGKYIVHAGPGGVFVTIDETNTDDYLDTSQTRGLAALIIVGAEEVERIKLKVEGRGERSDNS